MKTISIPDKHKVLIIPESKEVSGQLELFSDYKKRWIEETLEIANTFNRPFFFSELRDKCGINPAHNNMWGALTKKMKAVGFVLTGKFRRSKTETRKGGLEMEWWKNETVL